MTQQNINISISLTSVTTVISLSTWKKLQTVYVEWERAHNAEAATAHDIQDR
jgi:hypothetical protein